MVAIYWIGYRPIHADHGDIMGEEDRSISELVLKLDAVLDG